jgi:hypothetical protein
VPETREQCASLGQLRRRQGERTICIHVLMLCHGGAKRRAKFELSASLNVIFISASSDGSASISANQVLGIQRSQCARWLAQCARWPANVPLATWPLEDKRPAYDRVKLYDKQL